MPRVKINGRSISLPCSRAVRLSLGTLFILGGAVGFLPIVGFWMVPVGVVILSFDLPSVRRFRRRSEVGILRRYRQWKNTRAETG